MPKEELAVAKLDDASSSAVAKLDGVTSSVGRRRCLPRRGQTVGGGRRYVSSLWTCGGGRGSRVRWVAVGRALENVCTQAVWHSRVIYKVPLGFANIQGRPNYTKLALILCGGSTYIKVVGATFLDSIAILLVFSSSRKIYKACWRCCYNLQ
jgi:hypothetical protein